MAEELHNIEVRVRGMVQGVFFRAFTEQAARRLGIRGWVKNEPDGSVSALLQHEDEKALREMIAKLREGPEAASVESVDVKASEPARTLHSFELRH